MIIQALKFKVMNDIGIPLDNFDYSTVYDS